LFVVDMISSRVVTREDVQTVVVQCVAHRSAFDIVCTSDPDSIISSPTPRAALDIGVEVTPEEADKCDPVLAGEFIAHA
jgi:hypothetical protein